ncbi:hypothetical protein VPH35_108751 [Triticum aestivum]|nr:uncharacterized protein LOC123135782 isoform X3 [Triticum aestivum]
MDARVPDLAARRPDAKSLLAVPAPPSRSLAQVQASPLFASSPWPPLLRLVYRQSSVSVNVSSHRLCSLSGSIDSSSTPTVMLRSAPEANMESAMEQEVPEGGEQKSDVAVIADLFSLKNVPPTHFSLTGCVVLFGAIL